MEDDNKPKLTLVKGSAGEKESPKPKSRQRSGNRTESGLTVKQEAFAQALASGLSNADAYRQSYDVTRMQDNSIHTEARRTTTT